MLQSVFLAISFPHYGFILFSIGKYATCFIGSIWISLTQSGDQTPLSLGLTDLLFLLSYRTLIHVLAPDP